MSDYLEYLAFALGVANVALIVRRSIWNYAFGAGSVTAASFVLWTQRLYLEAGLQIFFLVLNLYGWLRWKEDRRAAGDIVVLTLASAQRVLCLACIGAAALALGWLMDRYTDGSAPYLDALITAASVAAQILLALRRIENWVLWIFVDVIAVPLYLSRGLEPLAALYAIFLLLSVAGLIAWSKVWRAAQSGANLRPQA